MIIANPIYDIVFKYLMEDERIARTILSALLKKDVVDVKVRPHEYTNSQRDTLSVFRIDFGATIREDDGNERLILIELQKTWLPTETLRFRQYLGLHYSNPSNIQSDGNALPTVAVYLLGHKVGDVEEPVVYVSNQSYDYNGLPVTKGLPNAFIDSLTHNSIIVQIPRLHGQINNRLDEVLSVFDQTRLSAESQHMLNIDENKYSDDDSDMQRILRRLLMAATDANMRHDMNVEDEYFSIIEKQDTEILMKTRELAEKKVELEESHQKLEESHQKLEESHQKLEESHQKLEESNQKLEESNQKLEQNNEMLRKTIGMLLKSGMTPEAIAISLGKSVETIRQLM